MITGLVLMMLLGEGVPSGGIGECLVPVNSKVATKKLHPDAFGVEVLARPGVIAVYIDGKTSCVQFDKGDAGCQLSSINASGHRRWDDAWVTPADVSFGVAVDGGVVHFQKLEKEPCEGGGILGLNSVCVDGRLVRVEGDSVVVFSRTGERTTLQLSGAVRTEDPDGSSVLMVPGRDRKRVASILGPQAVIPYPPFGLGEFGCGSRVCWGISWEGEVVYISRVSPNSVWKVAGRIARWSTGGRSVVVGGEETGLFYDPHCGAVYSAITPDEFAK
jgi:hypothetical protein